MNIESVPDCGSEEVIDFSVLVQFTDTNKQVIFPDETDPANSGTILSNQMTLGTTDTDSCGSLVVDEVTIETRADFYDTLGNTLFVKVDMNQ